MTTATLLVPRSFLILKHLQTRLDEVAPVQHDFLKFREQIVTSETNDVLGNLKEMLEVEKRLSCERAALETCITNFSNDEKKKPFAVAKAKLAVVERKLKETTKNLNRCLIENGYINANLQKMLEDICWMKQRIDENEVNVMLISEKTEGTLETTIQKKERTIAIEKKLIQNVVKLNFVSKEISEKENVLRKLRKRVENVQTETTIFRDGKDQYLAKRQNDMDKLKEFTMGSYDTEKKGVEAQIADADEKLARALHWHPATRVVQDLSDALEGDRRHYSKHERSLDDQIAQAAMKREESLKQLLQLRAKWQDYEKFKASSVQLDEGRRLIAAEFIAKKLGTKYTSKLKKKPAKNNSKRKKKR